MHSKIFLKVNLHSIRFSYVFVRFFTFLLLLDSHILDKSFPKKFFCKGVQPYFEISLLSFIPKIFEQNFYLYITVYVVRIWTHKNADEKAHTLSSRSKNVKKRTKTHEKRILCNFTFRDYCLVMKISSCKSTCIDGQVNAKR